MTDDLVGLVLDGRYRVVAPLASGGMATVYRGHQLNVDRDVAIKVMRAEDRAERDLVARFESEAKIISKLSHPNTLKLIDYGRTDDGMLYLVTELLEGRPLSRVIREEAPLDPRRVLKLMREVCLSLAEAHERGIVHRDLKPANIFLQAFSDHEVVKVLDFGVAKISAAESIESGLDETPRTNAGVVLGTPAYLSPEQAFARPVDGRADLYSLGVVAFHCLTGELPFRGEAIAQIAAHGMETPPRPSTVGAKPALPGNVEALILRLLDKEPDRRTPSAVALAEEIEGLLDDPEERRTSPLLWLAPILAAVAALAAYVALEPSTAPPPIVRVAPDAGAQVDAVSSDEPPLPSTATVSSAAIPPDAGIVDGLRVLDVEIVDGFEDPAAVERTIDALASTLVDCHELTQRADPERTLELVFEVATRGRSLSVAPRDDDAERFRRCVAVRLPSIDWPGSGSVRVRIGDRGE